MANDLQTLSKAVITSRIGWQAIYTDAIYLYINNTQTHTGDHTDHLYHIYFTCKQNIDYHA